MPDFDQALSKLHADDLKLILPLDASSGTKPTRESVEAAATAQQDSKLTAPSPTAKKKRSRKESSKAAVSPSTEDTATSPQAGATPTAKDPVEEQRTPQVEESPTTAMPVASDIDATPRPRRRRRGVAHVWPAVGSRLTADYHGQRYTAEIISAVKRLKSGRQIRLLDGPSKGHICDSFSEAMLLATARQRQQHNLGRRGVANGWTFWVRQDSRHGQVPPENGHI